MIRTLKIESFKSLVELELELGRVNLLIGANGSGKSNLLEAIGIPGAAAFGRVDDETLLRRGVRPGVPKLYKTAFPSKVKVNRTCRRASLLGWPEGGCPRPWTSCWLPRRTTRPSPVLWMKCAICWTRRAISRPALSPACRCRHRQRGRDDQWTLSRMWMNGLLGGVPNV
jgi:hypothetical protein